MRFVIALVVLAGCDQGEKPRPAPPPPPPAVGVIRGHVTRTLNGPGRAHAPSESFSRTTTIECVVAATDASGHAAEVKSGADGAYELHVRVGHWTVLFGDCAENGYCPNAKSEVDVTAGAPATADFDCEIDAK